MTWASFNYIGPLAALLWLTAGASAFTGRRRLTDILMVAGIGVMTFFIVGFWLFLERPPLRTMGETRLWYSFFLSLAGFLAYKRWGYNWLLGFSGILASVFVGINIFKPEIHSAALMPALQSVFFVPHVTVYMLSYSVLAVATIASLMQLRKISKGAADTELYAFIDNLVHIGLGFLMLGLISGAIWAKEAWGHYWSWDPKETWDFITAAAYLLYIHMRLKGRAPRLTLWTLPLAFVMLMITWLGVSLLPAAQGSVHVY